MSRREVAVAGFGRAFERPPEPLSVSIGVMGVIVVAAVCVPRRSRRCSRCAGYRTQTSPHRSANASSVTPAGDSADCSAGASPEQQPTECALGRIVGVRRSCRCR